MALKEAMLFNRKGKLGKKTQLWDMYWCKCHHLQEIYSQTAATALDIPQSCISILTTAKLLPTRLIQCFSSFLGLLTLWRKGFP